MPNTARFFKFLPQKTSKNVIPRSIFSMRWNSFVVASVQNRAIWSTTRGDERPIKTRYVKLTRKTSVFTFVAETINKISDFNQKTISDKLVFSYCFYRRQKNPANGWRDIELWTKNFESKVEKKRDANEYCSQLDVWRGFTLLLYDQQKTRSFWGALLYSRLIIETIAGEKWIVLNYHEYEGWDTSIIRSLFGLLRVLRLRENQKLTFLLS